MLHKFTNNLAEETSPYLLQHAHNPVNWFAWGADALQKAKAENKVILVSIGYSACHWCHVMERESFENETVAALMNANFINIKIDREERPDLDHIYMDAVQAISGSGGWPLNVFLTPEAKPFYGGTYYPPVKAYNRSSWTEVLQSISQSWIEKENEIISQADNLTAYLTQSANIAQKSAVPVFQESDKVFNIIDCDNMFAAILKTADKEWGGFGNAPKFPQTATIKYLLQYQHISKNEAALTQALLSIDKMLEGGIYDQVGGGLARYSTDKEWLAPHFEKMLYDNALLIDVLCDAFQITGLLKYKTAILNIIAFVKTELTQEEGGFYAALDADSEGIEGKYYVWNKIEIDEILGKDAPLFCKYFDISTEGNWEGVNILRILQDAPKFIIENNLDEVSFNEFIINCLNKLKLKRSGRIKPALDDKIILGWNALMLKSIAQAASILQDQSLADIAEKNYAFLENKFNKTPLLPEMWHTYKNGQAKYPAFLDDYAYLISACLQLYEINFNVVYLEKANIYTQHVIDNFGDEENIFFYYTNAGQTDVIVRKKEIYDGATPSGNSIMALNILKLSIVFDKPEWRLRSVSMLLSIKNSVLKFPGSFGIWASLLQQICTDTFEVAVVGENAIELAKQITQNYLPYKVIMASKKGDEKFPLLKSKYRSIETLIYLCKQYNCLQPSRTITEFLTYV